MSREELTLHKVNGASQRYETCYQRHEIDSLGSMDPNEWQGMVVSKSQDV